LDVAYRYTPLDSSFYGLLDTLSNSLQNCIFNALNRDYFFYIYIFENNKISGQIYPYRSSHCTFNPIEVYRNAKRTKKGFFYYNEKLVLVEFREEHWSQFNVEQYFSSSYCMEEILYSIPAERLPEVGMGLEIVDMDGLYDPIKEELIITKHFGCRGNRYYGYYVQESDNWETVAEKFVTTVEKLKTLNGKYNPVLPLVPGSYIEVYYEIVDGFLDVVRTR